MHMTNARDSDSENKLNLPLIGDQKIEKRWKD